MRKVPKFVWTILACLLCVVVTAGVCLLTADRGASSDKYLEIIKIIGENYYGEQDVAKLEDASADAMLASLGDPWSRYLSPEEYEEYKLYSSNQYIGVGITTSFSEKYGYLAVTSVTAGSPADRAHIQVGNMIAAVNNTDVSAYSPLQLEELIRSFDSMETDAEKTFTLHLLNSQGGKAEADLQCELIYQEPVTYQILDDEIAHLVISNFEDSAAASLKTAVDAALAAGAKYLILDVRGNTGGKPAEVADALDYLLPKGDMFLLRDREGRETTYSSGASYVDAPMVVLVNEETACAGEIFAQVLQSNRSAIVVGKSTAGSSQSQVVVELADGSAVLISKYVYLTPERKTMAELGGVTPDVASYMIEDSSLDVQLEAAKDVFF